MSKSFTLIVGIIIGTLVTFGSVYVLDTYYHPSKSFNIPREPSPQSQPSSHKFLRV